MGGGKGVYSGRKGGREGEEEEGREKRGKGGGEEGKKEGKSVDWVGFASTTTLSTLRGTHVCAIAAASDRPQNQARM